MKKNLRYMMWMVAALTLGACQTDDWTDDLQNPLPEGFYVGSETMEINMGFVVEGLASDASTRSKISGKEETVNDMKLLCFDQDGYFLGMKDVPKSSDNTLQDNSFTVETEVREDYADIVLYKGKIKTTVPDNTARLHIITNRNLQISGTVIGRLENALMSSDELASDMGNSDDDRVTFWGYHREATSEAFKNWIDIGNDVVYLLRDRARVELGDISDLKIKVDESGNKMIEWVITNGLSRGYIAPMDRTKLYTDEGPFSGYYTGSGDQAEESTTYLTPYNTTRFTATEADLEDLMARKYLFEDANPADDPIRIILKVTYDKTKLDSKPDEDVVKYHVLLFKDNNDVQRAIYRNRTYKINIIRLNEDLGETSFEAALTTTQFSNDLLNYVNQEVKNINSAGRMLQINDGTTKLVQVAEVSDELRSTLGLDEAGSGAVWASLNFKYVPTNNTNVGISDLDLEKDFHAEWVSLQNHDLVSTENMKFHFTYDETTGDGVLYFTVNNPTATLHDAKLRLWIDNYQSIYEGTDKINRLLSRTINVYSKTQFTLSNVTLKNNNSKRTWVIDYGSVKKTEERDVYKLTFTLPDDYPTDLMPINIKFATSTLNAFSDDPDDAANTHGTFSCTPESTAELASSDTANDWNYHANEWSYWYNYEIRTFSLDGDGHPKREFTLYLCDVTGKRENTSQDLGLYLKIDYFGDVIAVTPSS